MKSGSNISVHLVINLRIPPGEDVLEELQGSALQDGFLLRDGVTLVGELLLQLL